jgi:hypothetical protein
MGYEKGDRVVTTRTIDRSTPYRSVSPVRLYADGDSLVKSIPAGTPGTVVEHILDLIVSFDERGIVGRGVPMDAVELSS